MQALERLATSGALTPTFNRDELAALHLPFDELTGSTRGEAALAEALLGWDLVALVGPRGSGKSSTVAWLAAEEAGLHVVHVPVTTALEPDALDLPLRFGRHVLATLSVLDRPRARARRLSLDKVAGRVKVGSPMSQVVGLEAEVAAEVSRGARQALLTEPDTARTAGAIAEALDRMDAVPVLALDDTDRIAVAWRLTVQEVRDRLFDGAVRWLAEHVSSAVVVATHDDYLVGGPLPHVAKVVQLPVLDSGQLAQLVAHRATVLGVDRADVDALLVDEVVDELHVTYLQGGKSIRRTISVLRDAADLCIEGGVALSAAALRAARAR